MVERSLSMREARGSIPRLSMAFLIQNINWSFVFFLFFHRSCLVEIRLRTIYIDMGLFCLQGGYRRGLGGSPY